jgi:PHS family inorganic phosphate transporter-like MFS transporter
MLGTAGNWFIFDIVFYANSLFNSQVTSVMGFSTDKTGVKGPMLQTFAIVLMCLPGYFVGVAFINKIGRKNVQLQGYACMTIWFGLMAIFWEQLVDMSWLFLILYGLSFFSANFGPNLTTYVIPGELYPSQAKATLHGLSAASGKVGAALGAALMPKVIAHGNKKAGDDSTGVRIAMAVCAGLAVFGFIWTIFLTPRYHYQQLVPQDEGETVGWIPLWHQRLKWNQRYWADHDGQPSDRASDSEPEIDTADEGDEDDEDGEEVSKKRTGRA